MINTLQPLRAFYSKQAGLNVIKCEVCLMYRTISTARINSASEMCLHCSNHVIHTKTVGTVVNNIVCVRTSRQTPAVSHQLDAVNSSQDSSKSCVTALLHYSANPNPE